jgi:hypothetical protein
MDLLDPRVSRRPVDGVLAFVRITGPETEEGYYRSSAMPSTTLHDRPRRRATPDGRDVNEYIEGALVMATGGDYIAVRSWPDSLAPSDMGVVVVRMSTTQTWRIHPAPGTYLDVAAVDETTLLAHESLTGANPNSFERWRRYDLAQLDAFAGPLTAPALDAGADASVAGGAP